jgi:hypothetical protein
MIGETSEPTYIQPEVSSSPVNSRPPFLHFSPPRSIPSNYYHRQFPTKVMVEPLSIVGAIAAATQLARYVFHCLGTLSDYPGDLRSAPDRIKELLAEVDDFISIAKSVSLESHTSARSNHLRAQVTRCVRTASALKQLLQPLRITDNDTRRSKLRKCISFRGKWTRIARMLGDINGSQARLLFFMTS